MPTTCSCEVCSLKLLVCGEHGFGSDPRFDNERNPTISECVATACAERVADGANTWRLVRQQEPNCLLDPPGIGLSQHFAQGANVVENRRPRNWNQSGRDRSAGDGNLFGRVRDVKEPLPLTCPPIPDAERVTSPLLALSAGRTSWGTEGSGTRTLRSSRS